MDISAFCYRVGEYRILLEEGIRSEVLPLDSTYPVPFSPPWCLGLASVRGDLYPIIDMHAALFHQQPPDKRYLLLLQHDEFAPVLVSCDDLPRQITVPSSTEEAEHPQELPGWIKAVWAVDNNLLLSADHLRLFRMISSSRQAA